MAKIHGFQCDRCGEFYEKNYLKNPEDKTGYNVIGFAFVNTAKQLHRYDLCDICIGELQEWIKDPMTHLTNNNSEIDEHVAMKESDDEDRE